MDCSFPRVPQMFFAQPFLPYKAIVRVVHVSRTSDGTLPGRMTAAWRSLVLDVDHHTWRKNRLWLNEKQQIHGFLSHEGICALLSHLNKGCDTSFLDNKREFAEFCRKHQLPHPRRFGVGLGVSLPAADLFVKYEDGVCGAGAERYRRIPGTDRWSGLGQEFTEAELVSRFRSLESKGALIVQPVLENHPEIEPFTNGSLCTLRVVTLHAAPSSPRVMFCALRMPAGKAVVDNFAAGGIAAGVLRNGVVMPGVFKLNPGERISMHPDSGFVFEGVKLPMFTEATGLCLKAHHHFSRPYFVGWDVAFTNDGPVLLEANTIWCVDLIQMSHGAPIAKFGFMEKYLHCLDNENRTNGGN